MIETPREEDLTKGALLGGTRPLSLAFPTPFPESTEFGKLLRPLYERLSALPVEEQKESFETFRLIFEYLKDKNLLEARLTREDILFFMGNPVGNLLRRPCIGIQATQLLDKALILSEGASESERMVKRLLLDFPEKTSWSQFVKDGELRDLLIEQYPEEGIFYDFQDKLTLFRSSVQACPFLAVALATEAERICSIYAEDNVPLAWEDYTAEADLAKSESRHTRFLTDPRHMFNIGYGIKQYLSQAERIAGLSAALPPLIREAYFLLVEDNPLHATVMESLRTCRGLNCFAPLAANQSADAVEQRMEQHGVYSTAERALYVIESAVTNGHAAPDIVLSDIELGSGNASMNGLDFVEILYETPTLAEQRPIILMIYSSNIRAYTERIKELEEKGIIKRAWNKEEFTPHSLVDFINAELAALSEK